MCSRRRVRSVLSAILRACAFNGRRRAKSITYAGTLVLLSGVFGGTLDAQSSGAVALPRNAVSVAFLPASTLTFPNPTDSNSPAVWDGQNFYVFNSSGNPRRARGTRIDDVVDTNPDAASSSYTDDFGYGRWLEAVLRDDGTGELYGWYHEEMATQCPQGWRYWPRIGAVVSEDQGETWDDLGIVLSPRDGTITCDTEHPVTNGGIGDFSVIGDNLSSDDPDHYVYFIFSSYGGDLIEQGISFARMLWADRDQPLDAFSGESRVLKWDGESWAASGIGGRSVAVFHDAQQVSWTSSDNNGYWGPSVHWNIDLHKYVALMSRSKGGNYDPDGIYMTYTDTLENPRLWALPKQIIGPDGNQGWYPQVIGDVAIEGTDKRAGAKARYFDKGQSNSLIMFAGDAATSGPTFGERKSP
jgi:hypothetical protein